MSIVKWSNLPLPEGHLAALVAGLVLQKTLPLRVPAPTLLRRVIGSLIAALGVLVMAWAVWAARDVDVASPTSVVTHGPYAHSRNPMYLGWTMVYLGIALAVGSRWLLILLSPVVAYTHGTVLREERRLETGFGQEYRRYRERVRRYL